MKRFFSLTLVFLLLLSVSGCKQKQEDEILFYYVRKEFTYGDSDSVLAYETREIKQSRDNLQNILSIYLQGPLDDSLSSPFPAGARLLEVEQEGDTLRITFSRSIRLLEGVHLTLAAAALGYTCFALTSAANLEIWADGMDAPLISLPRDSLTLLDDSGPLSIVTEPTKP